MPTKLTMPTKNFSQKVFVFFVDFVIIVIGAVVI